MSEETPRIAIDDATPKQLRYFAGTVLGLDAKSGMNTAQLKSLILQAMPAATSITAEPEAPPAMDMSNVTAMQEQTPEAEPATIEQAGGGMMSHYSSDPKVELIIQQTADKTRSKDVSVAVNGDVFRMQRGQTVSVPYRVYLALVDAKEMQAVETGEIHPQSGLPMKEWQEVQSYPFSVITPAAPEAIKAFHRKTDNATASTHSARAA